MPDKREAIIKAVDEAIYSLDKIKRILADENKEEKERLNADLVKVLLIQHKIPADDDFITDLIKTCNMKSIHCERLKGIIEAVSEAREKTPIRDIKKYVFSCIYKNDKRKEK